MEKLQFNQTILRLRKGDITRCEVAAIVNAAMKACSAEAESTALSTVLPGRNCWLPAAF